MSANTSTTTIMSASCGTPRTPSASRRSWRCKPPVIGTIYVQKWSQAMPHAQRHHQQGGQVTWTSSIGSCARKGQTLFEGRFQGRTRGAAIKFLKEQIARSGLNGTVFTITEIPWR